jgi:hypothetical protein
MNGAWVTHFSCLTHFFLILTLTLITMTWNTYSCLIEICCTKIMLPVNTFLFIFNFPQLQDKYKFSCNHLTLMRVAIIHFIIYGHQYLRKLTLLIMNMENFLHIMYHVMMTSLSFLVTVRVTVQSLMRVAIIHFIPEIIIH